MNRHTVDAEQFAAVYAKARACDDMVPLGLDEQGRARFTTEEMLLLEREMIEKALALSRQESHEVRVTSQVMKLTQGALTLEQRDAFDHLVKAGGLACLVGYAGTGKSYLLGAVRAAFEREGLSVSGVTLSGIAAEHLQGGSGMVSRTFASRCHYWDKGEQRLTPRDVLVVDEAGMLSSRQMGRLLAEVHSAGAKVILVGDPQQLQAIEAGAAFRAIIERVPTVELTEVRRQRVLWQQEATRELARGECTQALARYQARAHVHAFETSAVAKEALVRQWNDTRLSDPSKSQLMLAHERRDVLELNELARGYRKQQGELLEEQVLPVARGERALAVGERVYFLKNDRSLGVMNGTLGTIQQIDGTLLTVVLDDVNKVTKPLGKELGKEASRSIQFTLERYPHLEYGYAATIHKAQGVSVDRSYVLASRYLDAHSSYVAFSRHRDSVDVFYGRDVFLSDAALSQALGRLRAKDVTLDYTEDRGLKKTFARERGITQDEGWGQAQIPAKAPGQTQAKTQTNTQKQVLSETDQFLQEKVLKRVKEYERLKGLVSEGGRSSSMAKDYLNRHLYQMAQETAVMAYVKEHHQAIAREVEARLQVLQRERGLGRGRGL